MLGIPMEFLAAVVAACVLAGIGERTVRVVPERWRWFHRSVPVHPVIAGAALGFLSTLPAPEWMGGGTAGRVLWYALAGVLAVPVYEGVRRAVEKRAKGGGE